MKFSQFSSQPDVAVFCLFVQGASDGPPQFRSPVFFGEGEKHLTPPLVAMNARTKSVKTKVLFETCRVASQGRRGSGCWRKKIILLIILVNHEMMVIQAIIYLCIY